jgi:hypothetical protein
MSEKEIIKVKKPNSKCYNCIVLKDNHASLIKCLYKCNICKLKKLENNSKQSHERHTPSPRHVEAHALRSVWKTLDPENNTNEKWEINDDLYQEMKCKYEIRYKNPPVQPKKSF